MGARIFPSTMAAGASVQEQEKPDCPSSPSVPQSSHLSQRQHHPSTAPAVKQNQCRPELLCLSHPTPTTFPTDPDCSPPQHPCPMARFLTVPLQPPLCPYMALPRP